MRADLKRLKREIDSGRSSVASTSPVAPSGSGPIAAASSSSSTVQQGSAISASVLSGAAMSSATVQVPPARKYGVAAVAVVIIAMVAAGIWYWRGKSSAAQIESIAVIPFANSGGNADTDLLSDGLTESLMASLAHVPELKVKSRNSVFRYKGKEIDVQQIGKDLTVDALLTGRVVQRGDAIQVNAELTNVKDNTEFWGGQYDRKAADVISLQEQIAGDIADKLRSKLTGAEKQQVTKQGTQNPEAYQLYVKGRYYWNKRTGWRGAGREGTNGVQATGWRRYGGNSQEIRESGVEGTNLGNRHAKTEPLWCSWQWSCAAYLCGTGESCERILSSRNVKDYSLRHLTSKRFRVM